MGFFNTDQTNSLSNFEKQIESFRTENKVLKERLASSVPLSSNHEDNLKNLKEMLLVVATLKQIEDKELELITTESEKFKGGIMIGVQDSKTKKKVLDILAAGTDKKGKSRYGYGYYDYTVQSAVLSFATGAEVRIPKFLLEEVGYVITDHIDTWSKLQDAAKEKTLDAALAKLGA